MVKFENQVALNKITRFVETSLLVIFFHCPDRNYFQKKLNKLLFLNDYTRNKKNNRPTSEDFTIKLVKNNYVKKALLDAKQNLKLGLNNCSSSFKDTQASTLTRSNLIFTNTVQESSKDFVNINLHLPKAKKIDEKHGAQNDKVSLGKLHFTQKAGRVITPVMKNKAFEHKNALFQGNRLILTLKKISLLNVIKDLIEDENIHILGGIYENCVIDHNQIKRLIDNSENNFLYLHLNNKLKENLLFFIYSLNPHYKMIALLKQKALKDASLT